jgi:hypothetical protein
MRLPATLALMLATTVGAMANDAPFEAIQPTEEEAWRAVCRDVAYPQYWTSDCNKYGRNAGQWQPSFLALVDSKVPTKMAELLEARKLGAAKKNIAYRVLRKRGVSHEDALVMCADWSIVHAYVNAEIGLEQVSNLIQNR